MTAALNIEDSSPLDSLLEAIAETLDVPQSAYDQATERYTAVGEWLCREGSSLQSQEPNVYPQGSFAIGTATKPLKGDDYDIDAVVELAGPREAWEPALLKAAVGKELRASGVYAPMLDAEGRRCWTLRYSAAGSSHGFHMDLLPSVPFHDQEDVTAIAITNRLPDRHVEWRESDPKKYALWFRERMQPISERRLRTDKIAGIEAVPFFETRVPLQYVVQLLKRYRDVLFQRDPENAPISIIITTLAAHAYRGEGTLADALLGVLAGMSSCIQRYGNSIVIPNPVRPNENFADRWQGDARKQTAFLTWLDAAERLGDALRSASRDQLEPLLDGVLGESSTRTTLAKFDARRAQVGARSLIRVPQPSSGSISGIVAKVGGLVANLPRLLTEATHRQPPRWPMCLDGTELTIRGKLVDARGALIGSLSSGESVRVGASLRFETYTAPGTGDIYWQVTNTGPEARRANESPWGLRSGTWSKEGDGAIPGSALRRVLPCTQGGLCRANHSLLRDDSIATINARRLEASAMAPAVVSDSKTRFIMYSERYGDLQRVAALTDGACHLCHEPADLSFYGPTGLFGEDTVTVDHLRAQHHGGSDRLSNLRLAHGTCNSIRGTRRVSEVRLELAGTVDAPMGNGEKNAWSLGGGAVAGIGAGYAFAKQMPDGSRQFNGEAAIVAGALATLLLRLAL